MQNLLSKLSVHPNKWKEMTEYISKSARKRRFKDEEAVAEELSLLNDKDLKLLPAGNVVKEEMMRCRSLQGGARKRQVKYLAKVMREEPVDDILNFLSERKGSQAKVAKQQREIERLRDVVINEAIEAHLETIRYGETFEPDWQGEEIDGVIAKYQIDSADFRKAVYQYVKTRLHGYYREVFRILKAAMDKDEMMRRRQQAEEKQAEI
jgi:ribosome-associated protein